MNDKKQELEDEACARAFIADLEEIQVKYGIRIRGYDKDLPWLVSKYGRIVADGNTVATQTGHVVKFVAR